MGTATAFGLIERAPIAGDEVIACCIDDRYPISEVTDEPRFPQTGHSFRWAGLAIRYNWPAAPGPLGNHPLS